MMRTSWAGALLSTAMAFAAAPAAAQDWYFGLSAGRADFDESGLDDAEGFKLYGGYRFNPFFGAQIGYIDLGESDIENGSGSVNADGYEAALVGRVPMTRQFFLTGKVGVYGWETTVDDPIAPVTEDDGSDGTLGVGAEYRFPNQIGLRAEYERFGDVGGSDVDFVSAGVSFGF